MKGGLLTWGKKPPITDQRGMLSGRKSPRVLALCKGREVVMLDGVGV